MNASIFSLFLFVTVLVAQEKPADPYFDKYLPTPAPKPERLLLEKGDRLAICGDSITEQKMYSRVMETYLTVCVPELEVSVRQYGWGGEKAPGFLRRMTNDVLRFKPTIATTCYGMNDHEYRDYEERIGNQYRDASRAIIRAFKYHGVRVVHGSPGPVGKVPHWTKSDSYSKEQLNLNLLNLRNIGVELANEEKVGFADVFWPMFVSEHLARKQYGEDYAVAGKDGVHPGWAGSFIMAYSFLKALGLDGELGSFTLDLASNQVKPSEGHRVLSSRAGIFEVESSRYPFCAPKGDPRNDDSILSGMTLVPFNRELNRFMLRIRNPEAARYKVTWGESSKSFDAAVLKEGINLAAEFPQNPFSEAFAKVDEAVGAKQAYETRQIKMLFHGEEGRADKDLTATLTEKARAPLVKAIQAQFRPVTHTIRVEAE
ncbi:MAG: SGNH/GDSL hydrolase family protein [Verrucomicrobiota bacterium]|nr:SGNH/GDSL hydrolase family protein [Verrucomicrobiota bacterium]